jgi:hypothetical protein
MLTFALWAMGTSGDFSQVGELADIARQLPAHGPDATLASAIVGVERLVGGDPAGAAVQLRSFVDYARRLDDPVELCSGGSAALLQGDEVAAAELFEPAIVLARDTGALGVLSRALEARALIELMSGHLLRAEADATKSVRLSEELGYGSGWIGAPAILATVAAFRGREQECRSFAELAMADAEQLGLFIPWAMAANAMAELDLSLGRCEQALDRRRQLVDRASTGQPMPMAPLLTTPARVEALVRSGRTVDPAELALFEMWAQYSPSKAIAALAARCKALLAADDEAATRFEEALALHEAAGRPLDRARTQLLYGEFLRRQRRRTEARTQLRAAMEAFDRLGALAWAERARTELRATGETVGVRLAAALELLTPQELQIVRLVSAGMSTGRWRRSCSSAPARSSTTSTRSTRSSTSPPGASSSTATPPVPRPVVPQIRAQPRRGHPDGRGGAAGSNRRRCEASWTPHREGAAKCTAG